jgi:hypothetical protein
MIAAAASVARADVETWHAPLSATISAFSGEQAFDFPLPLFDTQGGARVLTDVQIGGTAIMTGDTQVRNVDVLPVSLTVQFAAGVSGMLPGGLFSAFQFGSDSVTDLFPDAVRGFGFVFEAPITGGVSNVQALAAPHGGGVLQSATFTAGLTLPPVPGVQWSPATLRLGGAVEIRYIYQVVPTPGAAGLVLLGGVGLAVRGRRRG